MISSNKLKKINQYKSDKNIVICLQSCIYTCLIVRNAFEKTK